MDKPLKDWTLGECMGECSKLTHRGLTCEQCPLDKICGNAVDEWDLSDKPRWTEQDKEDARMVIRVFNGYQIGVRRDDSDQIATIAKEGYPATTVNGAMFPSLRPGQSVLLSEIIGGAAHD